MHLGPQPIERKLGRRFFEHDDSVDGAERCHDFGTLGRRYDWATGSLETPNRLVGIHADHEHITELLRSFQTSNVTLMEKIEGAVGPHDPQPGPAPLVPLVEQRLPGNDSSWPTVSAAGRGGRSAQPPFDLATQLVFDDQLGLLNLSRGRTSHHEGDVDRARESRRSVTDEPQGAHSSRRRGPHSVKHVRRLAARTDRERNVAASAKRFDLTRKHVFVPEVVRDRRESRRIRRERDRGQRLAVELESADELRGKVLRVGCTAAVPENEQLSATPETRDEIGDRVFECVCGDSQRPQALALRRHYAATASATACRTRSGEIPCMQSRRLPLYSHPKSR